jgi:tRNA A37 N6-isopentenylltransferase MiaA
LASPTGGGKTELCSLLDPSRFEIVSFDSRQIYKVLSIGTAKPEKAVLDQIRHHLVDIIAPHVKINAAAFVRLAEDAIEQICLESKETISKREGSKSEHNSVLPPPVGEAKIINFLILGIFLV